MMPKIITRRPWRVKNLTGQTFGFLTVIEPIGYYQKNVLWSCKCACGRFTESIGPKLRTGHTNSCGCLRGLKNIALRQTHGEAKKGANSTEYETWCGMKKRCYNEASRFFPQYGGRGISVCSDWKDSFEAFRDYLEATIGRRPGKGYSIDRINNDGNYEPGNIRWATHSQQNKNRRRFAHATEH